MNIWIIVAIMSAGLLLMVAALVILLRLTKMKDAELRNGKAMELKVQALKIIMPLKVQAYERFLLYLERVQLPQLVKRIYRYLQYFRKEKYKIFYKLLIYN